MQVSGEKRVFPTSRMAGSSCGATERAEPQRGGRGGNELTRKAWEALGQWAAGSRDHLERRSKKSGLQGPPPRRQNHGKQPQLNPPVCVAQTQTEGPFTEGSPTRFLTKWDGTDFAEP